MRTVRKKAYRMLFWGPWNGMVRVPVRYHAAFFFNAAVTRTVPYGAKDLELKRVPRNAPIRQKYVSHTKLPEHLPKKYVFQLHNTK
jgi:hypothetical protein